MKTLQEVGARFRCGSTFGRRTLQTALVGLFSLSSQLFEHGLDLILGKERQLHDFS